MHIIRENDMHIDFAWQKTLRSYSTTQMNLNNNLGFEVHLKTCIQIDIRTFLKSNLSAHALKVERITPCNPSILEIAWWLMTALGWNPEKSCNLITDSYFIDYLMVTIFRPCWIYHAFLDIDLLYFKLARTSIVWPILSPWAHTIKSSCRWELIFRLMTI